MLNSVNHLLMTIPVINASEGFPCAKVIHCYDICKDPDDFNIKKDGDHISSHHPKQKKQKIILWFITY